MLRSPDLSPQPELRCDEANGATDDQEEEREHERPREEKTKDQAQDPETDEAQELDADPVRAAQSAREAGFLELGVGRGDHAALLPSPSHRCQPLDRRTHDPLVERLLHLHLFQRLRLDHELRQARLNGILRWTRGNADRR